MTKVSSELPPFFKINSTLYIYSPFQINISEDTTTFVFLLTYVMQMLLEIFIPSYFGSSVISKGDEISYAVFQTNWIGLDKDVKQSMRILMLQTMQPIQIRSVKTFTLNLTTMMKVL